VSEGGPQRIAQNFAANLSHWAANYVVSALAISLVAVLMNPSFLVVSLVLGALWLYSSLYMQDISVPLGGRTIVIGMRERSIALTVVTVVLCYVANVTSTLLWIIGACVVAIVLHALFRVPEDQATEADFSLGEVV
jgi:hypothetical protein